uniref:Uncharacterized protein n=1 Tax=Strigamia maritima TaxID=126957 RepID=T1J1E7_STRMM
MKYNFPIPSLENIALVKTAVSINSGTDWTKSWETFEKEVCKRVNDLTLPTTLKSALCVVAKHVGRELKNWIDYLLFAVLNHDTTLWIKLLIECTQWTIHGKINVTKTALNLSKSQNLPITARFDIACVLCISSEIEKLWNEFNTPLRKHIKTVQNEKNKYKSMRGRILWSVMSEDERSALSIKCLQRFCEFERLIDHEMIDYEYTDGIGGFGIGIIYFLLSHMTELQVDRILCSDFGMKLFQEILCMMVQYSAILAKSNSSHRLMVQTCVADSWMNSSPELKNYVHEHKFGVIFSDLCVAKDFDNIELLSKGASIQIRRRIVSKYVSMLIEKADKDDDDDEDDDDDKTDKVYPLIRDQEKREKFINFCFSDAEEIGKFEKRFAFLFCVWSRSSNKPEKSFDKFLRKYRIPAATVEIWDFIVLVAQRFITTDEEMMIFKENCCCHATNVCLHVYQAADLNRWQLTDNFLNFCFTNNRDLDYLKMTLAYQYIVQAVEEGERPSVRRLLIWGSSIEAEIRDFIATHAINKKNNLYLKNLPSLERIMIVKTAVYLWKHHSNVIVSTMDPFTLIECDGRFMEEWSNIDKQITEIIKYIINYSEWTMHGQLDITKTARVLSKSRELTLETRFDIACMFCFSDAVEHLWNSLTDDLKRDLVKTEREPYLTSMVKYWTVSTEITDSKKTEMFLMCMEDTNLNAMKYFWSLMSEEQRNDTILKFVQQEFDFEDIQYYRYINNMNEHQIDTFLSMEQTLDFFTPAVNRILNRITPDLFSHILIVAADSSAFVLDRSHYCKIQDCFTDLWTNAPSGLKNSLTNRQFSDILAGLCSAKDLDNVELLLSGVPSVENIRRILCRSLPIFASKDWAWLMLRSFRNEIDEMKKSVAFGCCRISNNENPESISQLFSWNLQFFIEHKDDIEMFIERGNLEVAECVKFCIEKNEMEIELLLNGMCVSNRRKMLSMCFFTIVLDNRHGNVDAINWDFIELVARRFITTNDEMVIFKENCSWSAYFICTDSDLNNLYSLDSKQLIDRFLNFCFTDPEKLDIFKHSLAYGYYIEEIHQELLTWFCLTPLGPGYIFRSHPQLQRKAKNFRVPRSGIGMRLHFRFLDNGRLDAVCHQHHGQVS